MAFAWGAVLDDNKLYRCYLLCTKMGRTDKTSKNLKTDSFDIFGLDLLTGDVQSNAYVYKPCEGEKRQMQSPAAHGDLSSNSNHQGPGELDKRLDGISWAT